VRAYFLSLRVTELPWLRDIFTHDGSLSLDRSCSLFFFFFFFYARNELAIFLTLSVFPCMNEIKQVSNYFTVSRLKLRVSRKYQVCRTKLCSIQPDSDYTSVIPTLLEFEYYLSFDFKSFEKKIWVQFVRE